MPVKAVSSKLLAQRWEEEAYRQHMDRMKNVGTTLDTTSPKKHPHLLLSLKKLLIEEEKQARYLKENKVLMDKIRYIVKGRGTIDQWNDHQSKSLNNAYMAKMRDRIRKENVLMLRRLKGVVSTMAHDQWEGDFKRHLHYKDMLGHTTKDYKFRLPALLHTIKTDADTERVRQVKHASQHEDATRAPELGLTPRRAGDPSKPAKATQNADAAGEAGEADADGDRGNADATSPRGAEAGDESKAKDVAAEKESADAEDAPVEEERDEKNAEEEKTTVKKRGRKKKQPKPKQTTSAAVDKDAKASSVAAKKSTDSGLRLPHIEDDRNLVSRKAAATEDSSAAAL